MLAQMLRQRLHRALEHAAAAGAYPAAGLERYALSRADPKFGDWATNAAMVAAKQAQQAPRAVAEKLKPFLEAIDGVRAVDIAGPGFLNLWLDDSMVDQAFVQYLAWLADGAALTPGPGIAPERILVEFVSANPTGPLHVGHGRGAAVGDSTARLLTRVGHQVTREYYVNDAGNQMDTLGASLRARALQSLGHNEPLPEDGYQGDYLLALAQAFVAETGAAYANDDRDSQLQQARIFAERAIREGIRADLEAFRVTFDHWRSERELHANGAVDAAIAALKAAGHTEQRYGALWFLSDTFGDTKPRVLVRDNGVPTYFAADIAYHREKFARGFDRVVDLWGADHHGYEPRVRAALQALGYDHTRLEVRFIQFVSLLQGGQPVSMSTRAGTFETLADVVKLVGADAARYFYLLRSPDRHLDFDLDLATRQGNDNPVYYVQYAHARVHSLLRKARERGITAADAALEPATLYDAADRALITVLLRYPEQLQQAACDRAPHQVVHYLQDLAAAFHGYYNKQRIVDADPDKVAAARLALAAAVGRTIADGLDIIGVTAPERM